MLFNSTCKLKVKESEIALLSDQAIITKFLTYSTSRKARNATANIIATIYSTTEQIKAITKVLISYIRSTEYYNYIVPFRVFHHILVQHKNDNKVAAIIVEAIEAELNFNCFYLTSYYTFLYYIIKLLKSHQVFNIEFSSNKDRVNRILSYLDEQKSDPFQLTLLKEYKLFKIKGYNSDNIKTFLSESKQFEISAASYLRQCRSGFAKDEPVYDSEDELDLVKTNEYDVYSQGIWIRAALDEELDAFYVFIVKQYNKPPAVVRISKDSGMVTHKMLRTQNMISKLLEKLKR